MLAPAPPIPRVAHTMLWYCLHLALGSAGLREPRVVLYFARALGVGEWIEAPAKRAGAVRRIGGGCHETYGFGQVLLQVLAHGGVVVRAHSLDVQPTVNHPLRNAQRPHPFHGLAMLAVVVLAAIVRLSVCLHCLLALELGHISLLALELGAWRGAVDRCSRI